MNLDDWLGHIESVHFRSIDLQLDRVSAVLKRILPDGPRFLSISVAGTNGKGTAVEALGSILLETGMRVGLYTSPHLVRYNERIRVGGQEAGDAELCSAFGVIEKARGDIPLTYFEFGTLAAFVIFEQRGVEIAILEVGMGGRLDAVNAVDASAALITSISIDHESWLGTDRESIAVEKAGIFRTGKPAICTDPDPPAAISECAQVIGAELYRFGADFGMTQNVTGWAWSGPGGPISLPGLSMKGFQANTLAGVIMTLMLIDHHVRIDAVQIRRGLLSMRMRGRFEIIAGRPEIILDVAHNMAAISALRDSLKDRRHVGRTLAVCGMLKDKPVREMAEMLNPLVDEWYVGTINDPRGCSADELAAGIALSGNITVFPHISVISAFSAARKAADPHDRIMVFGSFHTVGDIIRALEGDDAEH